MTMSDIDPIMAPTPGGLAAAAAGLDPNLDYDKATFNKKTFHRKFDTKAGWVVPSDFPAINWAEKEQLEMLFPRYMRELLALPPKMRGASNQPIDIDPFDLRTPNNDRDLFKNAKLYIEPHKRCAVYGANGVGKTCIFEAITNHEVIFFNLTTSSPVSLLLYQPIFGGKITPDRF